MAALKLDERQMRMLIRRINEIEARLRASGTLKRQLGKLLVEQTRRRITSEKTAPSGRKWAPWTPEYAATRSAGHSLLVSTGALRDSIKASVTKDGASVTAGVDYSAAVNNARTFLGISSRNAKEIDALIADWMDRSL